MHLSEQQQKYEALQNASNEILPQHLYRFRSSSELSFSAFDKDQLWVSTADCMNDGFDTRIYVDVDSVKARFSSLTQNKDKEILLKSISDIPIAQMFPQVLEKIKSLEDNTFQEYLERIEYFITEEVAGSLLNLPSISQQVIKFACFSECIDSAGMWGLYASDESGFALEYDFHGEPIAYAPDKQFSRECLIFPVVYGNERYSVSTDFAVFLLQYRMLNIVMLNAGFTPEVTKAFLSTGVCPDLCMATKISLHKSEEWEKEKEWRLFCTSINDYAFQNSKHGYCIKRPKAIYLGRRISEINEKMLIHMAREKGIEKYKMRLDDNSLVYRLRYRRI